MAAKTNDMLVEAQPHQVPHAHRSHGQHINQQAGLHPDRLAIRQPAVAVPQRVV